MHKNLISLILLFSFQAHANPTILQGTQDGIDFQITLNEDLDSVTGQWGPDRPYSLTWNSSDLTLQGKTWNDIQNFYYDSVYHVVSFESACGLTQLTLDFAHSQATGIYCEQKWGKSFSMKGALIEEVSELILQELVKSFPEAANLPAHDFFKTRVVKAFNSDHVN